MTADAIEELIDRLSAAEVVGRLLPALNTQERTTIEMRFGLGTGWACSLHDAAKALGVTKERVRQIEFRALDKMRVRLSLPRRGRVTF